MDQRQHCAQRRQQEACARAPGADQVVVLALLGREEVHHDVTIVQHLPHAPARPGPPRVGRRRSAGTRGAPGPRPPRRHAGAARRAQGRGAAAPAGRCGAGRAAPLVARQPLHLAQDSLQLRPRGHRAKHLPRAHSPVGVCAPARTHQGPLSCPSHRQAEALPPALSAGRWTARQAMGHARALAPRGSAGEAQARRRGRVRAARGAPGRTSSTRAARRAAPARPLLWCPTRRAPARPPARAPPRSPPPLRRPPGRPRGCPRDQPRAAQAPSRRPRPPAWCTAAPLSTLRPGCGGPAGPGAR